LLNIAKGAGEICRLQSNDVLGSNTRRYSTRSPPLPPPPTLDLDLNLDLGLDHDLNINIAPWPLTIDFYLNFNTMSIS
jgi:hypothetical protein